MDQPTRCRNGWWLTRAVTWAWLPAVLLGPWSAALPALADQSTAAARPEAEFRQASESLERVRSQLAPARERLDAYERWADAQQDVQQASREVKEATAAKSRAQDAVDRYGDPKNAPPEARAQLSKATGDLEDAKDEMGKAIGRRNGAQEEIERRDGGGGRLTREEIEKKHGEAEAAVKELEEQEREAARKADEAGRKANHLGGGGPASNGLTDPASQAGRARARGRSALADMEAALRACDPVRLETARRTVHEALGDLARVADLAFAAPANAGLQELRAAAHGGMNELVGDLKSLEERWAEKCGGLATCVLPAASAASTGGPPGRDPAPTSGAPRAQGTGAPPPQGSSPTPPAGAGPPGATPPGAPPAGAGPPGQPTLGGSAQPGAPLSPADLKRLVGDQTFQDILNRSQVDLQGTRVEGLLLYPEERVVLWLLRRARQVELLRSLLQLGQFKTAPADSVAGGLTRMARDVAFTDAIDRLDAIARKLGVLTETLRIEAALWTSPVSTPKPPRITKLQEDIAELEAERDSLLTVTGVDRATYERARGSLLAHLRDQARGISRYVWQAYVQALKDEAEFTGRLDRAQWQRYLTDAAYRESFPAYQKLQRARDELRRSLEGNALLAMEVSVVDGFGITREGYLFNVLTELGDLQPRAAQAAIDQALAQLEETLKSEEIRIKALRTVQEVAGEFGKEIYAPLRARVAQAAQPLFAGDPAAWMVFIERLRGLQLAAGSVSETRVDLILSGLEATFGLLSFVFPPAALVEAGLIVVNVVAQGNRLVLSYGELSTQEGAVGTGGSVSRVALAGAEGAVDQRLTTFVETFAFSVPAIGLTVIPNLRGIADAADTLVDTLSTGRAAARSRAGKNLQDALDAAIPGGRPPAVASVTDADSILSRLDQGVIDRRVYGTKPNAGFFKTNALEPVRTIETGGQTFHVSRPFTWRGRPVVIAYQEAADGKVVPRLWYLSSEHGVWRALPGRGDSLLNKGPERYVDPVTGQELTPADVEAFFQGNRGKRPRPDMQFINESVVDLPAEVQPVLVRHLEEHGVIKGMPEGVADKAMDASTNFTGGPPAKEYTAFVKADDARLALRAPLDDLVPPAGARPISYERFTNHRLYGDGEMFVYASRDESVLFVVIRDGEGNVFVPSIQDAQAGVTPFGTRWSAYKTDLNSTPWVHGGEDYARNPGYQNFLNQHFAGILPPRGSTPMLRGGAAGAAAGAGAAEAGAAGTRATTGARAGATPGLRASGGASGSGASLGSRLGTLPWYAARVGGDAGGPYTFMVTQVPLCWWYLDDPIPVPAAAAGGFIVPFKTAQADLFRDAEQDKQVRAEVSAVHPDDPFYLSRGSWGQAHDDQWGLRRIGFTPDGGGPSAWDLVAEARHPIVVAVIDSGLDYFHPDLRRDSVWRNPGETLNGLDDDGNGYVDDVLGWNFVGNDNRPWDDVGHGTHVAGIIAAATGNGAGIAGINPQARIMPLKVLDSAGRGRVTGVAEAVFYAVRHGARVINLSLGERGISRTERLAIDYAHRSGAVVVVAAGNAALDTQGYGPAGVPGAVTVAAVDAEDRRLGFSNWGTAVKIAAPGADILSLRAAGTDLNLATGAPGYQAGAAVVGTDRHYYRASGTSFAAPFVSGVASLLLSRGPALTAAQVERMLLMSAADVEAPGWDRLTGAGRLDGSSALRADPDWGLQARVTGLRVARQEGRAVIEVHGAAAGTAMKGYTLELGMGQMPAAWKAIGPERTEPVEDGLLGTIPAAEITGRGKWTIRAVSRDAAGTLRESRATLNVD